MIQELKTKNRITHCIYGHERTKENTYINSKGHIRCKVCQQERDDRRYKKLPKKERSIITHCIHGHEYTIENTLLDNRGHRRCKKCLSLKGKKYREENPKPLITWSKKFPEKRKKATLKHRLKKLYNLTIDQYNILLELQNNCCNICGNSFNSEKQINVDHCHETGKVRGLLCSKCNWGIGLFNESIESLEKAIHYLYFHKNSNN